MNVIRSYQQEVSEITLATSRRLGYDEPGEGCLVPVHMRAGRCPITEGPIRAWTVETIGELEPGDSPDGSGQNPVEHICQGHRRWGATVLGEAGRAARNERCQTLGGLPARRMVRRPGHTRGAAAAEPDRVCLPRGEAGKRQGWDRSWRAHQANQGSALSSSSGREASGIRR